MLECNSSKGFLTSHSLILAHISRGVLKCKVRITHTFWHILLYWKLHSVLYPFFFFFNFLQSWKRIGIFSIKSEKTKPTWSYRIQSEPVVISMCVSLKLCLLHSWWGGVTDICVGQWTSWRKPVLLLPCENLGSDSFRLGMHLYLLSYPSGPVCWLVLYHLHTI